MVAQPWSRAQAKNSKRFQVKLDKATNYLVDGYWYADYAGITDVDDGIINYVVPSKPFGELDFSRDPSGALTAQVSYIDPSSGDLFTEDYIVVVQPFEKSLYMIGLDDGELVLSSVNMKSDTLTSTIFQGDRDGDGGLLGIFEYTRSSDPHVV
jgi:hypothetical protein